MSLNEDAILGNRITPNTISITFAVDGRPVVIARDNPAFDRVLAKLRSGDYTGLRAMCNPSEGIKSYFNGKVQIKGGAIYVNGEAVHSSIVPTILGMIREGQNPEHFLRFLLLLEQNPSMNSRNQLWGFIQRNDIVLYTGGLVTVRDQATGRTSTLDATGYLVLYKGVRENYTDCHTGKFLNKPGFQLEMPRAKVDDDINVGCSAGFHAGAFQYVESFGQRKLLVLVNPADVVSVPEDCSFQKLRTCRYTVLKEVEAKTFSKIETTSFEDDGLFTYAVAFRDSENDVDGDAAVVRALDAEHAIEIVRERFEVFEIIAALPVEVA